ncbi:MAG: LysR family transcriptional regulator [Pseudomonadota bacterium]
MRAFHDVMLTGSISQTARNLNRTQPSISATIANLETSLGMKLFDRKGGRLHAVPEARYLFEECGELLKRVEAITQNMRRIRALESGELRIASMPGPSVFLLPDIVAKYAKDKSDIKTTLVSRSTEAVIQLLAAQQYDIGICDNHPNLSRESGLIESELVRFSCLCAVPAQSPLASEKTITIDHLDAAPIGILMDEHPVSIQLQDAFASAGLSMNVAFATQYFIPLLTYVENGLACAVVDPVTAQSYRLYRSGQTAGVVFKPFHPEIVFELAILRPNHRPVSLLARDFVDTLISHFRTMADGQATNSDSAVNRT